MTLLNILIVLVITLILSIIVDKYDIGKRKFQENLKYCFVLNYIFTYLIVILPKNIIAMIGLTVLYIPVALYFIFD